MNIDRNEIRKWAEEGFSESKLSKEDCEKFVAIMSDCPSVDDLIEVASEIGKELGTAIIITVMHAMVSADSVETFTDDIINIMDKFDGDDISEYIKDIAEQTFTETRLPEDETASEEE